MNGSQIEGKQIIIEAPLSEVVISDSSTLWASGQSIMTYGTHLMKTIGAAFIGQAGYCGGIDGFDASRQKTYGYFSRLPQKSDLTAFDDEIGSIGRPNDVETAGGGRILIYADSLRLEGVGPKIQANARPYASQEARRYSLMGGSGGYIFVKTAEVNKKNSISPDSTIEAKGGYAFGKEMTGGSGGVVVLDNLKVDQK